MGALAGAIVLVGNIPLAVRIAHAGEPAAPVGDTAAESAAESPTDDSASKACVSAYEDNQVLRQAGELLAARDKLLVCAQSTCPEAVRADCLRWLDEVQRSLPTIVVAARDVTGADTTDVRVFVDGTLAAESLDGRPIPMNPGAHDLWFEHGDDRIDRKVVVQQGVRERRITVSFAPDPVSTPVPPPPAPDAPEEPGPPVLAFVLGGLGVAALGAFAGFGLVGSSEASDLNDTCGPTRTCADGDIDAARTKLIVADVSLGVGIVSLGIATTLLVLHATSEPSTAIDVGANVSRTAGSGWISARF